MNNQTYFQMVTGLAGFLMLLMVLIPLGVSGQSKAVQGMWNFEDGTIGELPRGWILEGTNQKGPVATWKIIEDSSASNGKKVLALTNPNHNSSGVFNLCWTNAIGFQNGEITVLFKANSGKEDQGGGIIWRAKDKNNYYIARYNPLEDNFRLYTVKNGDRKMKASATIALPAGKWNTMKIIHDGDKIAGYLNGKKLLEATDSTFTEPGGVGLWTKADAATSFDDLSVTGR